MSTFKNLLIYSISIIALFSLTAISCDDIGDIELPDITAPMDIEKTYVIDTSEAAYFAKYETIDPAEDLAEYKDRIKSAEIEKISAEITELLDGNSAITDGLFIIYDISQGVPVKVFEYDLPDFSKVSETIEIPIDSEAKEFLKNAVENDEKFDVGFDIFVTGPSHYQVDVTFHGVITASAE
ncbi:hypothetical protein QYS49_30635 [Marivirga salinae]|uniref:DUF4840 domain-containing protein n=1 Tax=Marivirga salinarum TaxID=3059078 RepID=A0AA49GC76_9BACT|nr:hypothetical protein [Marivirga sp. BDSF4-3]WKK75752.2 hypothetical protein QYS49_30635 [Marivirga sp. BDSF4-3]